MKQKPSGAKYRNLYARGDVIVYERVLDGRRWKLSTGTSDWNEAAAFRELFEQRQAERKAEEEREANETPLFRDFQARYRREDVEHLAATTRADRAVYLREDGPLLRFLGDRRLAEITPALLREWWAAEITGRGLRTTTGRKYLDVLAAVLAYAMDLGLLETTPVPAFREQIRRRTRTQRGRAEADPGRHVRPVESAGELARLLAAADAHALDELRRAHKRARGGNLTPRSLRERAGGLRDRAALLAMLDAGLRVGEVAGLTWGQVRWGEDEDDPLRALVIDRSRPRGRDVGPPKSGRPRTVALSRRLRDALGELYRLEFRPGPEAPALPGFDPQNLSHRGWRKIVRRAGIGHRKPKDLRDTYASWLLSLGVQLGYVSAQLGHADVQVTARHYARWCGGDAYREPLPLEPGEVPADLIARVAEGAESHHESHHLGELAEGEGEERSDFGELLERETGLEPATLGLGSRCSTS